MKVLEKKKIPHIEFIDSPLCIAGFSTRKGGKSKAPFNSLNLGLNTADDTTIIKQNRVTFYNEIAPGFDTKYMAQMHSNTVHKVDKNFKNNVEGDAFYTTKQGILLTISAADCGTILIHDEDFTICAAIHCGWRGAKDQIIEKTISELSAYVKRENLIAYIGPMIQQLSYEVGREFLNYFPESYFKICENRYWFDLNSYIEYSLIDSGVGRVHNSRLDTFKNSIDFFSYRRDGETGRLNGYIGIVK